MKLLKLFLISILILNNCLASHHGYDGKCHRGDPNPPPHNPYNYRPDPRGIPMPEGGFGLAEEKRIAEAQRTYFVRGALFAVAIIVALKFTESRTEVQQREMKIMQKHLVQWQQEGFAQDAVCSSLPLPAPLTLEDVREYALQNGRDSCKKLQTQLKPKNDKTAACPRKAAPFVKSKPKKCKQNYR